MTANLDSTEIAHFASLADQWWDPQGSMGPLHTINPVRLAYIAERTPLIDQNVLDVGCGGGLLSEGLAELGAKVTGIDLCEPALNVARNHAQKYDKKINYSLISVEELANSHPASFDIVTCLEMLEHTPDPASIISAIAKLTKPGGHLFFSTLNRTLKAWVFAILGAEYIFHLIPKNTHDYNRFIRPATLNTWLRQAGLECIDMAGLHYQPFVKKAKLTTDLSINYIIYARKL